MSNKSLLKCTSRKFYHDGKDLNSGKVTIATCEFQIVLPYWGCIAVESKGTSVCLEGEAYDFKLGERIAYKRAKIVALNEIKAILSKELDLMHKEIDVYENAVSSLLSEKEVLKDRIDEDIISTNPIRKA